MNRSDDATVRLHTWADAREALRHRDLRQGLYDVGVSLMDGVIVNLHGAAHTARRRLENRLFRRDTFVTWERDVIPQTVTAMLAPHLRSGRLDLIPLARRTMMSLAADIAGVDRRPPAAGSDEDEFQVLYNQMGRLARASTVIHAVGDTISIIEDGDRALAEFETRFLTPSIARRRTRLDAFDRGEIDEHELPRDVLSTLLRNQDQLELPYETLLREVAYYPWVGSHSTSNAFVHAMHRLFGWERDHPGALDELRGEPSRLQRFVHEALRLHPASPETHRRALADVELSGGARIPAGRLAIIDMVKANRDRSVFGPDADAFDPDRVVPDDVAPWGLSFGHGFHACLGQELAGGLAPEPEEDGAQPILGAITVMARSLLDHGARPDPDRDPALDPTSTRGNWGAYPVVLGRPT